MLRDTDGFPEDRIESEVPGAADTMAGEDILTREQRSDDKEDLWDLERVQWGHEDWRSPERWLWAMGDA